MVHGHVSPGVSLHGTYTVRPDCTFIQKDTVGNTNAGVFAYDRQEGLLMETVEGVNLTFTLKRIRKNDRTGCTGGGNWRATGGCHERKSCLRAPKRRKLVPESQMPEWGTSGSVGHHAERRTA
jgi:hypothetical protein